MSNKEIKNIIEELKETYEGDPWFGRNAKAILAMADERKIFEKKGGEHSILELLWHMITWREFVVDRLQHSQKMQLEYFEKNDWRELDHQDKTLWPQGIERLEETQVQILSLLKERSDDLLDEPVRERTYNYRKLLQGIIQHDIYHLGQIAYAAKKASSFEL
jgi:uncharacterized damage-inducible protein DinB